MKQLRLLFVFCLLPSLVFAQDELQIVKPEGCYCSILMPNLPKRTINTDSTGGVQATISFWTMYGNNKLYGLEMCVYDAGYNFADTKELLAQRDNFCTSTKSEMQSTSFTKQDGYSGIDFTSKGATNNFYSRILIVDKRVYILFVAQPTDATKSPDVDRFLNSFNTLR